MINFRALQGKNEKGGCANAQEVSEQQEPIREIVCDSEEEDLKRVAGKSLSKTTKAEGHRGCCG